LHYLVQQGHCWLVYYFAFSLWFVFSNELMNDGFEKNLLQFFLSLVVFLYIRFYGESLCKPISSRFVNLFFLGCKPLSSRWFQLYANDTFCCLLFMCMFHILIKKGHNLEAYKVTNFYGFYNLTKLVNV